jgi:peptidoglycan/xylan/chitin deacetylase (PgdA/CDA1 family)
MARPKLKFITSWDDGLVDDMRVARLLLKYQLPGIFYIPTNCNLTAQEIMALAEKFEIGGHTVSHFSNLRLVPDELLEQEIKNNKSYLEFLTEKEITKFCYPRGRYDKRVQQMVAQCGFTEARTTIVLKTKTEDPFATPTSLHIFQRDEYKGKTWDELAPDLMHQAATEGDWFHLWGHTKELNEYKQWEALESFFKKLIKEYEII